MLMGTGICCLYRWAFMLMGTGICCFYKWAFMLMGTGICCFYRWAFMLMGFAVVFKTGGLCAHGYTPQCLMLFAFGSVTIISALPYKVVVTGVMSGSL
jgi:hypothetical protein